MRILLFFIGAFFVAAPVSAQWPPASPLIDGACSTGVSNAGHVIATAIMDSDKSVALLIAIGGKREKTFALYFSDGTTQVLAYNRSDQRVDFDLSEEALNAFRASDSFRLYEHNRGWITAPLSLSGSSQALDSLYECVEAIAREEADTVASQIGDTIPPFSLHGIESGMLKSEAIRILEDANFTVSDRTFQIESLGPEGERLVVNFEYSSEESIVDDFFVVMPGSGTTMDESLRELERKYGDHSAVHALVGYKIWYRTQEGQILRELGQQSLCPDFAGSRLSLQPSGQGTANSNHATTATAESIIRYEIAVNDCWRS